MLEELVGNLLVGAVIERELERDGQHVEAVHAHPGSAIRLFQVSTAGQLQSAVEDTDVVQTQKPALEDVESFWIFAIDPPGEVQQELVEGAFQKCAVRDTGRGTVDLIYPPHRPGMYGRIDVIERPFIRG